MKRVSSLHISDEDRLNMLLDNAKQCLFYVKKQHNIDSY